MNARRAKDAVIRFTAVLALALFCSSANGAVDVRVSGHESLSAREVRRTLVGDADGPVSEERLAAGVDSLVARLAEVGRPFAVVETVWDTTGGDLSLDVTIDEGPEVRVRDIRLAQEGDEGAPRPEAIRAGGVVTGRNLKREIESLLNDYANEGYPFARVIVPRGVDLENGGATIDLKVDPGPRTVFGDVLVTGNEETRDNVIARETGVVPGEPYSRAKVENIRPRLERLRYLRSVSEPVVAVDPATGEAIVGVDVSETAANRISGVFGFSGPSGQEELTGLVEFGLGNIMGSGRSLDVSWEQFRANENEISFSYLEPWLLGAPVDVGVSGAQSVRDTLYTTTEGDVFVSARFGDRTRLTWSVGAERYVPGTGGDESSTTSARTALSVDYDMRDVPINPSGGVRLTAGASYAAKKATETGEKERSGVFRLGAERYFSVVPGQVLAVLGRGAVLSSTEENVPLHELLTLGGARSLRGYREEQFHGTRIGLGTVEYRFLLTRRSRALAFVDVGYYYLGGSNPAKGTKLGYGIGLRGDTRLGTISIDYGLGEGDGLLDGKLHVGLAREF